MVVPTDLDALLRPLAPRVLAALVRRYDDVDLAEEAVQEALLAAATRWPGGGTPDDPLSWLIAVASRRLIDLIRSERSRRRRETAAAALRPPDEHLAPPADVAGEPDDDAVTLLFLCCHPALSPPSQVALTLRAVGGLTTEQIARAFLVPESTMAQRISRAKQRIKATGARFADPPEDRAERLRAVLHVLYLVFNEGYTATSGPELHRAELTAEAIRLTRIVHRQLPDDGEVAGLLALMLLCDARRPARTGADGGLIPLAEQDRGRWDRDAIAEGVELLTRTLATAPLGPYQLHAAIAAVHAESPSAEETDWPQVLALYELLQELAPSPVVALNRAVAAAMVHGPRAGLDLIAALEEDRRLAGHHRLHAVRAHLLERAGDHDGARTSYRIAARLATSLPEQRYLREQERGLARAPGR
ncbi:RNA polymerase sigma factor [Saccharopolyspora cebuensis]|uniref:RNA polymerase sigma factor n=1 Tax=Saccharopolyspora cebuensis TaxID=418759 RepID=A0ABV4CCX4_9PSEU